jgi:hypothetical protein
MNTNHLKRFAQEARTKLIEQVGSKMEYVLTSDSSELREKASQVRKLQEAINASSKEQVIDRVAYTWFNRLMALRFMDANDYQPIGIRVVTPKDGYTLPELLDEAKQGHIPDELPVKKQHVYDVLDGRVPSANPQNEAYKELLIGACNHLHQVFPFLFEKLSDYTELLLPDDLISEFSIVQDIRDGMTVEDCQEVEIIGWIYQFYISEKKDEVFASKSKVKKEDIPAATQLFTPRWIVEYMVQNTVGKLWLQNRPNSKLREHMPYFIESPSVESEDYLKVNSVEEITLLDQACGSGHILVYGFELFTKIYEEEGYNPSEIPQLIIEKNLFGFEIDERAAQLAGLALLMKARSYQRRVFKKELKPNILCYQDLKLSTDEIKEAFRGIDTDLSDALLHDLKNMQQATNFGSLIIPHSSLTELEKVSESIQNKSNTNDAFLAYQLAQLTSALNQLIPLGRKYHCVVDNPPYMGGGNMNKDLADFVKTNYPASKSDLMACFMEAGLKALHPKGFLGMINQHSWMFLSSYEKLREKLVKETFFDTLLHLGPRTFPEIGGEVVQNASFTFWNSTKKDKGSYIRLVDYNKSELKRNKTIEAIQNPNCGWFFTTNQRDFQKIAGSPIGYWLSEKFLSLFNLNKTINDVAVSGGRNKTHKDIRYVKFLWEVSKININENWLLYENGGQVRKWYGNQYHVVDWSQEARDFYIEKGGMTNSKFWQKEGIVWSMITNKVNFRHKPKESEYSSGAPVLFVTDKGLSIGFILGYLNTKIAEYLISSINPTLNTGNGVVRSLPFGSNKVINSIENNSISNINISKQEWFTRETSLDFQENELIRIKGQDLEETYDLYQQYWKNKFFQLHKNEEELNKHFIEIYGLQEELTPEVPIEDITILKEETKIVNGQLVFQADEIFQQFMSYAVGCMFGRYSLDKEGLILANQGETLEDYLNVIARETKQSPSFLPDDDNIIPVLDDEWFEDDIVNRFNEFLKVSFGKDNFEKNLAFVEECLGKDVRKYFVKDFYADHIKRYKKRPIYWMFSSPKGAFNVLIYMHRYTPDTINQILNGYLKEYREKLNTHLEQLDHLIETGSSSEQTKASKEKDKLKLVLLELQEYERKVLYPFATERIAIDLDDGVLVNYNKFGKAIKEVSGLNDAKTKKKVKTFDWIDVKQIR